MKTILGDSHTKNLHFFSTLRISLLAKIFLGSLFPATFNAKSFKKHDIV